MANKDHIDQHEQFVKSRFCPNCRRMNSTLDEEFVKKRKLLKEELCDKWTPRIMNIN